MKKNIFLLTALIITGAHRAGTSSAPKPSLISRLLGIRSGEQIFNATKSEFFVYELEEGTDSKRTAYQLNNAKINNNLASLILDNPKSYDHTRITTWSISQSHTNIRSEEGFSITNFNNLNPKAIGHDEKLAYIQINNGENKRHNSFHFRKLVLSGLAIGCAGALFAMKDEIGTGNPAIAVGAAVGGWAGVLTGFTLAHFAKKQEMKNLLGYCKTQQINS